MNARMPWPLVEAFLVLTEELQLGRAADRLGVSRQTLSRRIDLLEAELGGRLVQRSTRRITLTRAGVVLRDRGTVVARMMDDLAWHTRLATDAHTLSVGISTDVTAPWATQVAVWVEARGTRAVLERRSVGSVVALVRESRLDLALVVGDVVDEPHSDVVGYETCVVVFPDTHPAAGRNAIRVGDLRGLVVAVSDVGRPEHHRATVERVHGDPELPFVLAGPIGTIAPGLVHAARRHGAVAVVLERLLPALDTSGLAVLPMDPPLLVPVVLISRPGLPDGPFRSLGDHLLGRPGEPRAG